jgi:hypothetical protein
MLFRKDIEPNCCYCRHAQPAEEGTVICQKKGIRQDTQHCGRFRYDPLRRTPPKPLQADFSKYDNRDFSL